MEVGLKDDSRRARRATGRLVFGSGWRRCSSWRHFLSARSREVPGARDLPGNPRSGFEGCDDLGPGSSEEAASRECWGLLHTQTWVEPGAFSEDLPPEKERGLNVDLSEAGSSLLSLLGWQTETWAVFYSSCCPLTAWQTAGTWHVFTHRRQ